MGKVSIVFQIAFHNIRKWFNNPRFYIVILLVLGFSRIALESVARFASTLGVKATPFAFVFFMDDSYIVYMMALCLILLFCDAPFIDLQQPYIMIRSGKKKWLSGQILYILIASLLFSIFIVFVSVLVLLPNITFDGGWGKVWGTLAQTDAAAQFYVRLGVPYEIILNYAPLEALLVTLFMSWLIFTFTGLVMFIINLNSSRIYGAIAGTLLATLPFASLFLPWWVNYISPYRWIGLNLIDTYALSVFPTRAYAISFLVIGIFLCVFIAYNSVKKKNFDVLPPV